MQQSTSTDQPTPTQTPFGFVADKAALAAIPASRRRTLALLGFPLAWFFANHYMIAPRGFHQALFWPLFLLVGLWFFKGELRRHDPLVLSAGIAVLTGSLRAALYASEPLTILNFFLLPLLAVFCLILAVQPAGDLSLSPFLSTLATLISAPFRIFLLPAFFRGALTQPQTPHTRRREIQTGLLLALPLVSVLFILLTRADVGFRETMGGFLYDFIRRFQLSEILTRFALSLLALVYFLGVMISIWRIKDTNRLLPIPGKPQAATVSLILLWAVNGLYALFTLTQLRTLYFPREELSAQNLTIAQYARSGFFSLLLVLVINLILLWALSTWTIRTKETLIWLKAGESLLLLFTANMIASSFYKMHLYESTYGYTHLRLFVKFALIFFTLSLPVLTAYLSGRSRHVLKPLVLLALGVYLALNLVNLDGLIARKAQTIYQASGRLDSVYLSRLSADAWAPLADAFAFDTTTDPAIQALRASLEANLTEQLDSEWLTSQPLARSLSELRFRP